MLLGSAIVSTLIDSIKRCINSNQVCEKSENGKFSKICEILGRIDTSLTIVIINTDIIDNNKAQLLFKILPDVLIFLHKLTISIFLNELIFRTLACIVLK